MSGTSDRLAEIARHRQQLSARSALQRAAIASSLDGLRTPVAVANRVLDGVHYLRSRPLLFGAGVAVVVALARGRVLPTVGRGLAAWRVWRMLSGLLALRQSYRRDGPR